MPRPTALRIRAKIDQYAGEPASVATNVAALKGEDALRLRVGDWRVIFRVEGAAMTVIEIAPRGSATD